MAFSSYLNAKRKDCSELVQALGTYFSYVSVLGTDVRASVIRADRKNSAVRDGAGECGFVIKMHDGRAFFEYSLDDISGDKNALARRIREAVRTDPSLEERMIRPTVPADEPLVRDFVRETDFEQYTDGELLSFCRGLSAR